MKKFEVGKTYERKGFAFIVTMRTPKAIHVNILKSIIAKKPSGELVAIPTKDKLISERFTIRVFENREYVEVLGRKIFARPFEMR